MVRMSNARARTKVKARRLILEADSSPDSSVAALQEHLTLAEWTELEAENSGREKDVFSEKDLRNYEMRPSVEMKRRATRKKKGKAIMTKEVTSERN